MATRHCGLVSINCTYRDREDDYRRRLSVNGKSRGTVFVGAPRSLRHAVDSPMAYDEAAHAAVSFALDDGQIRDSEIESTTRGDGWNIRRQRRR